MFYHGEISELDREEFAGLREKLSKVLNVVMRQNSSVSEVADSLRKLVEISNGESRGNAPGTAISDEAIANLEKDLAERLQGTVLVTGDVDRPSVEGAGPVIRDGGCYRVWIFCLFSAHAKPH
jgi:hypothetical protein